MSDRAAVVLLTLALLAPVDSCDRKVQAEVQSRRRPALEGAMRVFSDDCNRTTVAMGLLAIALLGGPPGVATAQLAVVALVPVNLAVEGAKRIAGRTRPDGEQKRSNSSFPSSHAANAFALAVILSRRWWRAAPLFFLLAALVAFARVYLNRHYPSDVVAGAALGAGLAWLAALGVDRWRRRRVLEPATPG
ncbi:MAG TPA: phosphatase PAP2 family protein [Candidatus Udaeobacter sp.]|jgi:undecaprenyl-diphosphatase|nr:phosphatase PAP2 family protein [Candidatus Udaeobacter sp.]